jgi:hypothetical protein
MHLGWIGSRLFAAGVALFFTGYGLAIAALSYASFVTAIGAAAVAIGSAALAMSPRSPFTGKLARAGLTLLAVGAASLLGSATIAAGMTFDPLESAPVVVLGLTGIALTPIGVLATLAALIRRLAFSRS